MRNIPLPNLCSYHEDSYASARNKTLPGLVKLSTEGYKHDSPDVNNKVNIIPSGDITMKGVNFPVKGVDNLGNTKIMKPGKDYKFPGTIVKETRI
jgi:hypothetical protein